MFYTGIDQHRRSSVLTTYTDAGQAVGHATLPNEPVRLRRYYAQFPGSHRALDWDARRYAATRIWAGEHLTPLPRQHG